MTQNKPPATVLARLQKQASKKTAPQNPIGQARLRKLKLEIRRLEHEVTSARLDEELRKENLLHADDAVRFITASLEAVSQGLRNAPDRYASRVNPDNFEVGRRGLQSLVCEIGELVGAASKKVAASGKPIL